MPIVFELKSKPKLPLDVRRLVPDGISDLTHEQIGDLLIGCGNRTAKVSQWFDVEGDSDQQEVVFKGSLENVHSIGHSMTSGSITVSGSVGRHVGASMSGGTLVVRGNADDYLGYEMQGGTIVVHGNAADHVGGSFPGAKYGMNRGTILISGSAGKGLGFRMRRGTIVVGGDVGEYAAWQMRAGTIMVFGSCGGDLGIDMKRGTILLLNEVPLGHTFSEGTALALPFVEMLLQWISSVSQKFEVSLPDVDATPSQMWNGDKLCGGRGEVFLLTN